MEHTLTIHKLIHGGKGLGTLADGMVVMVAGVLPGESVTVRETKVYRGHKEAELIRVEQASPKRVDPPCPHYGHCGGCNLQHADYATQLEIKQEILRESLQRARLELTDDHVLPTLPAPEVFGYRHRIRLHLDREGHLGYHEAASNVVVPIRRCLLATEPINRVLDTLVDQDLPARLKGLIREIELIHSPADDRVILILHPQKTAGEKKVAELRASLPSLDADIVVARKKIGSHGRPTSPMALAQDFSLAEQAYQLRWAPSCFFQANVSQNPHLVALALKAVSGLHPAFTVLDLFCGMGNFSIPLALNGAQVLGIEHNHESIHWAAANCSANNISTARFIGADVQIQLKKMVKSRQQVDCILLDPPRQGLGGAAALLPQLRPQSIISISCDPATQARDLREIINGGYRLARITPVDMFPQTHHIESLALLERN